MKITEKLWIRVLECWPAPTLSDEKRIDVLSVLKKKLLKKQRATFFWTTHYQFLFFFCHFVLNLIKLGFHQFYQNSWAFQSTYKALTNSEICMSLSVLAKISQSFKNKRYSRFFCRNVSYLWKAVKFMEWEIEKYGFHHWLELEKYFEMLINFN